MKRKRFLVEQIVVVLKQVDVGVPAVEVCRQLGTSVQTLYRWKKQFVGFRIVDQPAVTSRFRFPIVVPSVKRSVLLRKLRKVR